MHSQYNSYVDSRLGKRDLYHPDLGCEPERKRTQLNLPEERRNTKQQNEFYPSQCLTNPNLCIPSFNNSLKPLATTLSAFDLLTSVPEAPAALTEDGDVTTDDDDFTSEEESGAGWSITYNSEVKRAVDVSFIRSLDLGPEFRIRCLKFSKDGKYLEVGLYNGTIKIYDVQTGEKTWLVCHEFWVPVNTDNLRSQYTKIYH